MSVRDSLLRPRPLPGRLLPALAGATVIALALPVFLLAGFPLAGWALGTALWLGAQALGALLARLRVGADSLAGSGVVGFGMMFRAGAVAVALIAVAVSSPAVALSAAALYALAYTLELALLVVSYFAGPAR
jgi:hypothetical protein